VQDWKKYFNRTFSMHTINSVNLINNNECTTLAIQTREIKSDPRESLPIQAPSLAIRNPTVCHILPHTMQLIHRRKRGQIHRDEVRLIG